MFIKTQPRPSICAVFVAALAVAQFAMSRPADAHSWTGKCTPNFDNLFALTWVYANARATFASETGLTGGKPALCNSSHTACWTYRHRCGSNYLNVDDDSGYGHFHLSFENPVVGVCLVDPGDGYGTGLGVPFGGDCVAPDWKREPRVLNTHDANQWIKITVEKSGSTVPKVFDMPRIRIGGTQPIQFWFRTTAGQWFYWPSLGPNNWNLSSYVNNVDLIRIKAAGSGGGTIQIEDFDILD